MRLLTIIFLIIFSLGNVFPQNSINKIHSAKFPDVNKVSKTTVEKVAENNVVSKISQINDGNSLFTTGYDYSYNNSALRVLDLVDINGDGNFDPVMVGYEKETETGNRKIVLTYSVDGTVNMIVLFDSLASYNSISLQYSKGGPFDNKILVLAKSSDTINWALVEVPTFSVSYFSTSFSSPVPSFIYLPDGTIWISTNDLKIYKSTDQGNSFNLITTVGSGDTNFGTPTDSPAELPIQSSPDGQYLSIVGVFEGASLSGNPDGVYWYHSTDAGNSWQGEFIGKGSGSNPEYGQIANRDYAPYFTNFAQGNSVVDMFGFTHVAFNGYGEGILPGKTETTNVFPIVYWNSRDKEWFAISDPVYEAPTDGFGNNLASLRPGNGIGQAYPTLSFSDDGATIVVAWQAVEFTGIPGASEYNIYPGDGGGNSDSIYYTDLIFNISIDGGQNFNDQIQPLRTEQNVEEEFPYLNSMIEVENGSPYIHYVYFIDPVPGVSLFSENDWNGSGLWVHDKKFNGVVSVEDDNHSHPENYSLEQNYPNPFNPSTKIKYQIADAGFVKLQVFNILGNEVATLINREMQPGSYEVNFDASNLPSGIYFYTLNSAKFTQTKKMILLK